MIDFNKELEFANTDEDDFDDNDPEFYIEFTSPDFRFLKQLKNTICDILRNYESKAS